MAINKTKNIMITATLSKADNEKLESITNQLSQTIGIELSKSQTISLLIRQFNNGAIIQNQSQPKKREELARENDSKKYQNIVNILKDKLNVSYPKLSELTNVSINTLKRYASGKQAPSEQNKQRLDDAVKRYGIKI